MNVFPDLKVLVVDDHSLQRRVAVRQLRVAGVTDILQANNGSEGLQILKRDDDIDLVLCDLNMPTVDGLTVIRELVEAESSVAVAFLSSVEPEILECVELMTEHCPIRFLSVLEKPMRPEQIEDLLQAASIPLAADLSPDVIPLVEIQQGLMSGQFVPNFQPIVDASTGEVQSVEVFARWNHPTRGNLRPESFLQQMEDHDGTDALTWVVLGGALKMLLKNIHAGFDIPVSINLSPGFLARQGIVNVIQRRLKAMDIRTNQVNFEITEGAALSAAAQTIENITRLRMLGHTLAIDNFGASYASLKQLVRVPAHIIKIDRTLLNSAIHLDRAKVVLNALISMIHDLKMHSLIEGVETFEQHKWLTDIQADYHQGFFYGDACHAEAFTEWLIKTY